MKNVLKTLAIVIVVLFGASLFILSNQVGGWRAFTVKSGSMEPTIKTGAFVVTQRVFPNTLNKDDVITFIRPDENSEFVTHRIAEKTQNERLTTFKTKGDANKNEDNWTLAGGSVVGKVQTSIPYLGYLLSFTQTKIGLVIFILVPAVYIVIDELFNIFHLFRKEKKTEHVDQSVLALLLLVGVSTYVVNPSQALLSDKATLKNNSFTATIVTPIPTRTPTPTNNPCGGNTVINISGNGAGSTNTVNVTNNCTTVINQSNTSNVTNVINNNSSTGGNTSSHNTSSVSTVFGNTTSTVTSTGNTTITNNHAQNSNTIITGGSNSNINVTTSASSNSATLTN